jgi:hypothetical protein
MDILGTKQAIPLSRVHAGWQRNRGSFPGRGKRPFSSPTRSDRVWRTPHLIHNRYQTEGRGWGGKGVPVVHKVSGDEADLSPPSCADFKNEWRYTFTPAYDFVACTENFFFSLSWVPEKSPTPHARCGAKKQSSRERIKLSTWAQNSSATSAQRTDRRLKPSQASPQFNYINSYRSSQKKKHISLITRSNSYKCLRKNSSVFWVITRRVVVWNRRFGITY